MVSATPQQIEAICTHSQTLTCTQTARRAGVRAGVAARICLERDLSFGGVEDKGAWPRYGATPPMFLPPPAASTIAKFEREARRLKVDPQDLASRCLDIIATDDLFSAILKN